MVIIMEKEQYKNIVDDIIPKENILSKLKVNLSCKV